jgi:hypothetical protein
MDLPSQPLNLMRFIRVPAALGLLAGLQYSRNCLPT